MYYPKLEEMRVGQKIQWLLFENWVDAEITSLEHVRGSPDMRNVLVTFFKPERCEIKNSGIHSEDGVYVKEGETSRYIRFNKVKATDLAKELYPDAKEEEGYLYI